MDQVALPGREKMAGPILPAQRQQFALGAVVFCAVHLGGQPQEGTFSRGASIGHGHFGSTRKMLPLVNAQGRGEAKHKAKGTLSPSPPPCPRTLPHNPPSPTPPPPQAPVVVGADLASPRRGCERRLQHARPSQAPSCHMSPIFLVSINSGTIFKYTKA